MGLFSWDSQSVTSISKSTFNTVAARHKTVTEPLFFPIRSFDLNQISPNHIATPRKTHRHDPIFDSAKTKKVNIYNFSATTKQ